MSNLTAIIDDDSGIQYSYKYNDQGIRTEKVVNGVTHKYYLQSEQIIAEKYGSNLIKFYYDATGICGFNYSGKDYYYRKNIQGDIIAIYDGSGYCYATYGYDAWGRFTIFTNVNGIADINPFRYRGYYYDSETNLYYLNSRYYDPEIGRFISADNIANLVILSCYIQNGLNSYVYCLNNPVNYYDDEGRFPKGHQSSHGYSKFKGYKDKDLQDELDALKGKLTKEEKQLKQRIQAEQKFRGLRNKSKRDDYKHSKMSLPTFTIPNILWFPLSEPKSPHILPFPNIESPFDGLIIDYFPDFDFSLPPFPLPEPEMLVVIFVIFVLFLIPVAVLA